MQKLTIEQRFWNKVAKTDGCWLWTGCCNKQGYGFLGIAHKNRRVNRVAWEITFGAIPKGLWVLHKCDNPRCVRPEHLFLGTHRDNTDDMVKKNRQACGEQNGNTRLTREQILDIKSSPGGKNTRVVADKYKIHPSYVRYLKHERYWKHLK